MEPYQLEDLYERYARELYLYAYSLCQNGSLAQDLVSDTFYKALLSLEGTDLGWRSWLYRVCRNLWMDHLRGLRRVACHPPDREPMDDSDGLPERFIREERQQAVYRAVQSLPDTDREMVTLYYYGQLSIKEAAEAMGLTPGAARTLLCRARKKLKQRLEGLL